MITGLTREQFFALPVRRQCPCDKCGEGCAGSLMRAVTDYHLSEGIITEEETHTALYLCSGCHWTMECVYTHLEKRKG